MRSKNVLLCVLLLAVSGCKDYDREFRKACHHGDINLVKKLLKQNSIDINKCAPGQGPTPFMFAAKSGNLKVVEFLASKGADINKKDGAKTTALIYACISRSIERNEIITFLLNNGAFPNERDWNGNTALMVSVSRNNIYGVKILLKYGADVNIISDNGKTALDRAILKHNKEIQSILREHGGKTAKELKIH